MTQCLTYSIGKCLAVGMYCFIIFNTYLDVYRPFCAQLWATNEAWLFCPPNFTSGC